MTDLVLRNGRIRIGDPATSEATTVWCRDGRIVAVGDARAADGAADDATVIDLGGRVVLPAFTDGHTHFQKAALARRGGLHFLDLSPTDLGQVLDYVAAHAERTAAGAWIRGDGLNPYRLREGRFPRRDELDAVSGDHPVVLLGIGNHSLAANTRALAHAGIDRSTPDPIGGRIERGPDGEPSGVLHELGKLTLDPNRAGAVMPRPTIEERMRAIEAAVPYLHERGIATIHDVVVEPDEIVAYMRLSAAGRLGVRVRLLVRGHESRIGYQRILDLGLQPGFGDQWLQFTAVKVSIDGAVGEGSAALYTSDDSSPGRAGLDRISPIELDRLTAACHDSGVAVAVHAIGQRAVDMALDSFSKLRPGAIVPRHRIEHAYLPPVPGQIRRMADLGLVVSTQPGLIHEVDEWTSVWPLERLRGAMPLRTMLRAGLHVMASSDYPYIAADPFIGIGAAVTRRTRHGDVLGEEEAIDVQDAIATYTSQAAFGAGEERHAGTIEPGKYADLVILDRDPARTAPDRLGETQVLATIISGEVRFQHRSLASEPARTAPGSGAG